MMNRPGVDADYRGCLDDCLKLVSYALSSQNRQESQIYFISGVLF